MEGWTEGACGDLHPRADVTASTNQQVNTLRRAPGLCFARLFSAILKPGNVCQYVAKGVKQQRGSNGSGSVAQRPKQ
jgi:hypothetical protein